MLDSSTQFVLSSIQMFLQFFFDYKPLGFPIAYIMISAFILGVLIDAVLLKP